MIARWATTLNWKHGIITLLAFVLHLLGSHILMGKGKRQSLHTSQVAHQAGAYPGFCSMKWLGIFPLPPGWDASPSQGYPQNLNSPGPIYTPGWSEALWELSVLPMNTMQCPPPGLEPGPLDLESSALTMMPPRLPQTPHYVRSTFHDLEPIISLSGRNIQLISSKLMFQTGSLISVMGSCQWKFIKSIY